MGIDVITPSSFVLPARYGQSKTGVSTFLCLKRLFFDPAVSRLLTRLVARNHVSGCRVTIVGIAFYKGVVHEGSRPLQSVGGRCIARDSFPADCTQQIPNLWIAYGGFRHIDGDCTIR